MNTKPMVECIERTDGAVVFLAQDKRLPRAHVKFILRHGALIDAPFYSGLTRIHTDLWLRGTKQLSRQAFHRAVENLGCFIHCDSGLESQFIGIETMSHTRSQALDLLVQALAEPAFSADELAKLRRELEADRVVRRDEDASLVRVFLRKILFAGTPCAQDPLGETETLLNIKSDLLHAQHGLRVKAPYLIAAGSGDICMQELDACTTQLLKTVSSSYSPASLPLVLPAVSIQRKKRTIHLIHKPKRTQAQIVMGQMSLAAADSQFLPAAVATCGFGGTFTSPLTYEVREVRGWSYGAYASLLESRFPGAFVMSAAPMNKDLPDCLHLMHTLFLKFFHGEFDDCVYDFGKQYLIKQYPFSLSTQDARLSEYVHAHLLGRDLKFVDTFESQVLALDASLMKQAVLTALDPDAMQLVVLCSVDKKLRQQIARLFPQDEIVVHSFDQTEIG